MKDIGNYITIDKIRSLYGTADTVHDFDHIIRVVVLAERIGKLEGADLDIVRTASILHDVGRAESQAADRDHAMVAAEVAGELLLGWGASQDWVKAVQHAIAAHRFRTQPDPQTIEAKVLFDADKLDAIGAIGVARAFAYGGAHQQRLWTPMENVDLDDWELNGDNDDDHTPVHEYVVKLSRIKGRLMTSAGLVIAEDRHAFMESFYQRLDAEVRGTK